MGPNSGGGRKNKALAGKNANTPARARFSTWKPPSKGVKNKFSNQKQERSTRSNDAGSAKKTGGKNVRQQNANRSLVGSQLPIADRILIPENIMRVLMKLFGEVSGDSGTKGISVALPLAVAGTTCCKNDESKLQPKVSTTGLQVMTAKSGSDKDKPTAPEPTSQPLVKSVARPEKAANEVNGGCKTKVSLNLSPLALEHMNLFKQYGFIEKDISIVISTLTARLGEQKKGARINGDGYTANDLFLGAIMRSVDHPLPYSSVSRGDKTVSASSSYMGADVNDSEGASTAGVEEVLCNEDLMGEVEVLSCIYGQDSVNMTPVLLFGSCPNVSSGKKKGSIITKDKRSSVYSEKGSIGANTGGRNDGIWCVRIDVKFDVKGFAVVLFIYHADNYPMGPATLGAAEGSRMYGWLQLTPKSGEESRGGPGTRLFESPECLRELSLSTMRKIHQQHLDSEAPVAFDFVQSIAAATLAYTPDMKRLKAVSDVDVGAGNSAATITKGTGKSEVKRNNKANTSAAPSSDKKGTNVNKTQNAKEKKSTNTKGKSATCEKDEEFDIDAPVVPTPLVLPTTKYMDMIEYKTAHSTALSAGLSGAMARKAAREAMEFILPTSAIAALKIEVKYANAKQERGYSVEEIGVKEVIEGSKLMSDTVGLGKAQGKELYLFAKALLHKRGDWYARDYKSYRDKIIATGVTVQRERLEKKEQKKKGKDEGKSGASSCSGVEGVSSIAALLPVPSTPPPVVAPPPPPIVAPSASEVELTTDAVSESEEEEEQELTPEELAEAEHKEKLKRQRIDQDSRVMLKAFKEKEKVPKYQAVLAKRSKLPAYIMKDAILDAIDRCRVVVVSGDTGCGKTTQIPQLVLDDYIAKGRGGECNMVVTQPRRISAVSVAEHISRERLETVGQTTGYHIRLEAKKGASTRLLLMTTGVLLRRLQSEDNLDDVSHVFVDEVHERDINTDFLLIVLKQLLVKNPTLKVILMSATVNASIFENYFKTFLCTMIEIPGRAFPVTSFFLEDAFEHTGHEITETSECSYNPKSSGGGGGGYKGGSNKATNTAAANRRDMQNSIAILQQQKKLSRKTVTSLNNVDENIINLQLIQDLVAHILFTSPVSSSASSGSSASSDAVTDHKNCQGERKVASSIGGAILIFVPGLSDIRDVIECLEKKDEIMQSVHILPLHSSLSSQEQSMVFSPPPTGRRKIIVSTNIAETSVTIEDVVYVIDTCKVKESSYDEESQTNVLEEQWHSQANARQRKGRAGRVQAGICYHLCCSFTLANLPQYPIPEMRRMSLEELILQVLALDLGGGNPYEFLASALTPPETVAITNSILYLESLNAVILLEDTNLSNAGTTCNINATSVNTNKTKNSSSQSPQMLPCEITPLGYHLAALPISPRIGKLMLYGVLLKCIDPVLTIASTLSAKSPFVTPFSERDAADAAKLSFMDGNSDLVTMLTAYESWRAFAATGGAGGSPASHRDIEHYCRSKYISLTALKLIEQMRRQFLDLLKGIGFVSNDVTMKSIRTCEDNVYGNSANMLKCAICAGLSPNILMLSSGSTIPAKPGQGGVTVSGSYGPQSLSKGLMEISLQQKRKGSTFSLHPSSVLSDAKRLDSKFFVYLESIKTSKMYVRDVTTVLPLTLATFSGRLACNESAGYVLVDGWIKLQCAPMVVRCILHIQDTLEDAFMEKVLDPSKSSSARWSSVLKVMSNL